LKENNIYDPQEIEKKWLLIWEKDRTNSLKSLKKNPKYYILEMFPYPSGEPHMGHARNYTIGDVIARVYSRSGFNVLHPIGYDAFGLPAENAAIKSGTHPEDSTMANIEKMRVALKRMAMAYDFGDEIVTCQPDYYRWTQWLFLLFYKMGLAEKKEAPVNWCDSCQTVLANEQVINGFCERCDSPVRKRVLSQWFFKITEYAQRLLDDMDLLKAGWPERVLTIQKNWIGRSEGAQVNFRLEAKTGEKDIDIPVFTTRPDTLYGVTFFILAAEHPLIDKIVTEPQFISGVKKIRSLISKQTDIERGSAEIEKTGCFTGRYVINPLNGERIPVWIANYVLLEYGTGAIMAVPAHDTRDFDFAKKYDIEIREVISPDGENHGSLSQAYTGDGIMINSGKFSGMPSEKGKKEISVYLEQNNIGKSDVNYKLKDWLISRQRYWGAPIPVMYCEKCGIVPVPEDELPVLLPYNIDFKPTGLSPLEYSREFVNTVCPSCGGNARRETDTMDTFVCSSWYFLRYCSPHLDNAAFDKDEVKYWMPVDQYVGGIEHASMHLIYARFFTKVLYDANLIDFKEPFLKYYPHGMVNLGGRKMSKSKGNIINPSEIYNKFGADTLRLYILFIGPADSIVDWSNAGVEGSSRFLKRFWKIITDNIENIKSLDPGFLSTGNPGKPGSASTGSPAPEKIQAALRDDFNKGRFSGIEKELFRKLHQVIKKVTNDNLKRFNFNTSISTIMELVNIMYKYNNEVKKADKNARLIYEVTSRALLLLSPVAPFITEELWEKLGMKTSIHRTPWPGYDEEIAKADLVTIVFQVNGKLRDKAEMPAGSTQEVLEKAALSSERIRQLINGKQIIRKIVVAGKLVNIVVKD